MQHMFTAEVKQVCILHTELNKFSVRFFQITVLLPDIVFCELIWRVSKQ